MMKNLSKRVWVVGSSGETIQLEVTLHVQYIVTPPSTPNMTILPYDGSQYQC